MTAYLDTKSPVFMSVDNDTWSSIKDEMEDAGFNCSTRTCFANSSCSALYSNLKNMSIVIGEEAFTIPPNGYLVAPSRTTCTVGITPGMPRRSVTLGIRFLLSYLVEFDYESLAVTFNLNPRATWSPMMQPAKNIFPVKPSKDNSLSAWVITFIVLAVIAVLVLVCYCCYRNKT